MTKTNEVEQYIEFFYPYNPDVASSMENTDIKLITERNPLLFIDEINYKIGFRFFEVIKGNNPYNSKNRKNISSVYYYGRYLNKEEVTYIHEVMPFTSNCKSMIQCACGYLVTELNDSDIALEEYLNTKKKIK